MLIFADENVKENIEMKCKWFAIALAVCLMMTMVGCGSGNKETTPAETTTAADTTPNIMDLPEYNAADYVTKVEYTGVEVTVANKIVTEDELEEAIQYLLESYGETQEITDRLTAEGDTIVFDYSGAIDGVVFEGGTAAYQTTTLGAGGWVDGFEEGLIGKPCGVEFVVDAYFPENYGREELNGKTAQFTMKIHYIEGELIVPELTDAFVQDLEGYTVTTVDEFKNVYYAELSQQKADYMDESAMNDMWYTIITQAEFKGYPENYVEAYEKDMINSITSWATMYGLTFEDYGYYMYGMELEEFEALIHDSAVEQIRSEVLFQYIAEKEGIVATEEEYLEMVQSYMDTYGYTDMASFVNDYGVDVVEKQGYADATLYKVMKFCYEKAVVTEAPAEETTASAE